MTLSVNGFLTIDKLNGTELFQNKNDLRLIKRGSNMIGLVLNLSFNTKLPTFENKLPTFENKTKLPTKVSVNVKSKYRNGMKTIPEIHIDNLTLNSNCIKICIECFSCGGGGCGSAIYQNMNGLKKINVQYSLTSDDQHYQEVLSIHN